MLPFIAFKGFIDGLQLYKRAKAVQIH